MERRYCIPYRSQGVTWWICVNWPHWSIVSVFLWHVRFPPTDSFLLFQRFVYSCYKSHEHLCINQCMVGNFMISHDDTLNDLSSPNHITHAVWCKRVGVKPSIFWTSRAWAFWGVVYITVVWHLTSHRAMRSHGMDCISVSVSHCEGNPPVTSQRTSNAEHWCLISC